MALFLLCGEIVECKVSAGRVGNRGLADSALQTWASSALIDRKIKFTMPSLTILAMQRLRTEFAACLSQRMASIPLTPEQDKWFDLGLRCIMKTIEEDEDAAKLRISNGK